MMGDVVRELLVTDIGAEKLGRRDISDGEVGQLLGNVNVMVRNPSAGGRAERRLLIGKTDGARTLTLVLERTIDPSTWVVVTGWTASPLERKMLKD